VQFAADDDRHVDGDDRFAGRRAEGEVGNRGAARAHRFPAPGRQGGARRRRAGRQPGIDHLPPVVEQHDPAVAALDGRPGLAFEGGDVAGDQGGRYGQGLQDALALADLAVGGQGQGAGGDDQLLFVAGAAFAELGAGQQDHEDHGRNHQAQGHQQQASMHGAGHRRRAALRGGVGLDHVFRQPDALTLAWTSPRENGRRVGSSGYASRGRSRRHPTSARNTCFPLAARRKWPSSWGQ